MICPVSGSNPVGAVAVFPLVHFQEMGFSDFHPQREFLMSISPLLILRCGKTEKSESVMIHAAGELDVGDADVRSITIRHSCFSTNFALWSTVGTDGSFRSGVCILQFPSGLDIPIFYL
jgi:hypothetical protein